MEQVDHLALYFYYTIINLIAIDFVTSEVLMKQILSEDIINQYMPTLVNCPLFNKLGEMNCVYLHNAKVIVHSYKKNDFIALSGDPMDGIGVILEGSALLTRENIMGQRVNHGQSRAIRYIRRSITIQ